MKKANLTLQKNNTMVDILEVNFAKPVNSVEILDDCGGGVESSASSGTGVTAGTEQTNLAEDLNAQKRLYSEVCQTLHDLATKLNQFYDEISTGHKDEIAKLSVEIARKILMQKVEDGEYEILVKGAGFEDKASVSIEKSFLTFLETDKPALQPLASNRFEMFSCGDRTVLKR